MKTGRPKLLRNIEFQADKSEREAIDVLRKFFGLKTRAKLLKHMLTFILLDIASLTPEKSWSGEKLSAWEYCQQATTEFQQALMLVSAERVLSRKKSTDTMSLEELSAETVSEFMPKEQLIKIAEDLGIGVTGKRKSGLVRAILAKRKANVKR